MGDDLFHVRDTRDFHLAVEAGEGNDRVTLRNAYASAFQTDGGADNDRIVLTHTTGRDTPLADPANVLGGTGDDSIVLRNTEASSPAVSGGEGDDAVQVNGVAADPLRLEAGLGDNSLRLDDITRNTEVIIGFRNFD